MNKAIEEARNIALPHLRPTPTELVALPNHNAPPLPDSRVPLRKAVEVLLKDSYHVLRTWVSTYNQK